MAVNTANVSTAVSYTHLYMIDGEVQRYENLVNGMPCREYIQVSIEEEPRIKRWKKGTMVTGERMPFAKLLREAYREFQENMFDSLER